MSGSHRRRGWLSSWWPRRRTPNPTTSGNTPSASSGGSAGPAPWWSAGVTRELPVLRYAPLMTVAQAHRGHGGRWTR